MTNPTNKAQRLAIDNLAFSALQEKLSVLLTDSTQSGRTNIVLSWPTLSGLQYQIEFATNLNSANWQALGSPLSGNGNSLSVTNPLLPWVQAFYRLKIIP